MSGKRDLNSRPQPWQGCALPTELLPHCFIHLICEEEETRTPTTQLSLPPQSSASTNSATSPTYYVFAIWIICAQNRTRTCTSLNTRTWNVRVYQFRHLGNWKSCFRSAYSEHWAANETWTRDPNLGKVVLYQLSYCRIALFSASAKV